MTRFTMDSSGWKAASTWTDEYMAEHGWRQLSKYVSACISEGFCPMHSTRLEPRQPEHWVESAGFCRSCGLRWRVHKIWGNDEEHQIGYGDDASM